MVARFLFLTLFILCNLFCVGECREFVFVASTGQTMRDADPFNKVGEGITWAIGNLREDDEVGIITFKDAPKIERQLSAIGSAPNEILNLEYYGQSNAGAALLAAVDMLTPKYNTERNIIFIGNGEISLDDSVQTLQSVKNFQAGLEQARWENISVYILNLRHEGDPENQHSYYSRAKEIPIPHTELMTALRTIIHNDFHAPYINLFEERTSEKNLSAKIPVTSAKNIKLSLISSNAGDATLENSAAMSGRYVNIFEINSPQAKNFEIALNYPPNTAITLDAVAEVEGTLEKNISPGALEITPVNLNGGKIFGDSFFENKPVRVKINDKIFSTNISGGEIKIDLSDEGKNVSLQKVFFEDVGVKFIGDDTAEMTLPENNYLPYILAGAAIILILFLAFRKKKLEEKPQEIPQKKVTILPEQVKSVEEPKKFPYSGKFAVYFTKSAQEEEISPREFNLLRVTAAQISFLEILKECGIDEEFAGAEKIFVSPSGNGIFLKNDSDCTVIKRNNFIEKGRQTEMFYGDSVNISSEDEVAEVILRYKSLKPA